MFPRLQVGRYGVRFSVGTKDSLQNVQTGSAPPPFPKPPVPLIPVLYPGYKAAGA